MFPGYDVGAGPLNLVVRRHMVRLVGRRSLILAAVVVALVPFPTRTVPKWRVTYVDQQGRPLVGLPVQETWQNYSAELRASRATLHTDKNGELVFPPRYVLAPVAWRVLVSAHNLFATGVHASFGSEAWLIAKCNVIEASAPAAIYTGGSPPDRVALRYFAREGPTPPGCDSIEEQARVAPRM